jgi:O-antigen/teichoic acid export membrane protein
MLAGLLVGLFLSTSVAAYQSRQIWWTQPGGNVNWKEWMCRVIPLVLGVGSFQFLFSADPLFVQYYSADGSQTGYYTAAGTLGRALCAFTGQVVAVMFPKIARSVALSEKSNYMGLTLLVTAVMVGVGAFGLTIIAPWLVPKVFYNEEYRAALPLLPWYAAAMAPLALANVLFYDLLARCKFAVVWGAVFVAAGYAWALTAHHGSFVEVLQTLCVANLVFLAVVAIFSWRDSKSSAKLDNEASTTSN